MAECVAKGSAQTGGRLQKQIVCHAGCAECAYNIWKEGGVTGMFRGNCATLLKVMPQTAVQFAVRPHALISSPEQRMPPHWPCQLV